MESKVEKLVFKVKDINLAKWGRKEIKLAEAEMPGLMSLREEFGQEKPERSACCWLHMIMLYGCINRNTMSSLSS